MRSHRPLSGGAAGDTHVVKIGGSLAASALLPAWLAAVQRAGRGRIVVVPGGGPGADVVRSLQRRWRLTDAAAHLMAIEAMDAYARLLAALAPGLVDCVTGHQIHACLAAGSVALWRPSRMALAADGLARNWSVTSDSIAAWLAIRMRARGLVLVKSCTSPDLSGSLEDLSRRGIVDEALPGLARGARLQVRLLAKRQAASFERYMAAL